LVYNSTVSFSVNGWKTIDVADFVYTSNQNLLVLCEANYGGNGAPSNPGFAYSYSPDQHEGWQQHETPPPGDGVIDANRPNIQMEISRPLSSPQPPSGLMAEPVSASQINLTWKKNLAGNSVMVACNTENVFGIPNGNYIAGNPIAGGGTVIYNGPATGYNQGSGLNPATTYYYRAWSVLVPTPVYSMGVNTMAATKCVGVVDFPYTEDFELSVFPPVCWSLTSKPWMRNGNIGAYGAGTGSAYADFYNILSGNSLNLVSPTLNLDGLSNPVISFDHAYATISGQVDRLELWVSEDDGVSFTLLNTWLGGFAGPLNTGGAVSVPFVPVAGQWATKSFPVSPATNKILLKGVSGYGNNLFIDNIAIGEPATEWNGSVSGQWQNPLNWTPNGIPAGTQDISITSGKPFNPVVSTIESVCKSLIINVDAGLTVLNGSVLTVFGNCTIKNGASLNNTGTLIVKGNLTNFN
jgi:hypothetical protein